VKFSRLIAEDGWIIRDGVKYWLYVHHLASLVCADRRPTPSAVLVREQVFTFSFDCLVVANGRGIWRQRLPGTYQEVVEAYRFYMRYHETTKPRRGIMNMHDIHVVNGQR
jgi:hypothetical protein